jgi:hypothetical protein
MGALGIPSGHGPAVVRPQRPDVSVWGTESPVDTRIKVPVPSGEEIAAHRRLLDRLERLSIGYLLAFRLEVGRLIHEELGRPDGPPDVRGFAQRHRERLSSLGLSEELLRQSVRAHHVMQHLPKELSEQLLLSHVIELARLHDPKTREPIARMALDHSWTVRQLRDAVDRVRAGLWVDAGGQPGLQPEAPPRAARPATPRRLTQKIERVGASMREQLDAVARLDPARVKSSHRARLLSALDGLAEELERARARVRSFDVGDDT